MENLDFGDLDESLEFEVDDFDESLGKPPKQEKVKPSSNTKEAVTEVAKAVVMGALAPSRAVLDLPSNILVAGEFTTVSLPLLVNQLMSLFGIDEIKSEIIEEIKTFMGLGVSWSNEEEMKEILGKTQEGKTVLGLLGYPMQHGGAMDALTKAAVYRAGMGAVASVAQHEQKSAAQAPLSEDAKKVLLLYFFMLISVFTIYGAGVEGLSEFLLELGRTVGKGLSLYGAAFPFFGSLIETIPDLLFGKKDRNTRIKNAIIKSGSMLVAGLLMIVVYHTFNFIPKKIFGFDISGHALFAQSTVLFTAQDSSGLDYKKILLVLFIFIICVGILTTTVGLKPSGKRYHSVLEVIAGMLKGTAYFNAFNILKEKVAKKQGGGIIYKKKRKTKKRKTKKRKSKRYGNKSKRSSKKKTKKRKTMKGGKDGGSILKVSQKNPAVDESLETSGPFSHSGVTSMKEALRESKRQKEALQESHEPFKDSSDSRPGPAARRRPQDLSGRHRRELRRWETLEESLEPFKDSSDSGGPEKVDWDTRTRHQFAPMIHLPQPRDIERRALRRAAAAAEPAPRAAPSAHHHTSRQQPALLRAQRSAVNLGCSCPKKEYPICTPWWHPYAGGWCYKEENGKKVYPDKAVHKGDCGVSYNCTMDYRVTERKILPKKFVGISSPE
jgi:hypothetical protein